MRDFQFVPRARRDPTQYPIDVTQIVLAGGCFQIATLKNGRNGPNFRYLLQLVCFVLGTRDLTKQFPPLEAGLSPGIHKCSTISCVSGSTSMPNHVLGKQ